MPKTKKPKTHFEQVPLEIVKMIAEEEIPGNEADGDDGNDKPPSRLLKKSQWVSS